MQFREVIGQQAIKKRLINAVRDNRVSHAQLFYGPEGCGNLALALAYAQYLSCPDRTEEDSCGACTSCRKFQNLQHADLNFSYPFVASKASKVTTAADVSQTWIDSVKKTPYLNLEYWLQQLDAENKQPLINVKESERIAHVLSLKAYEGGYKFMVIWLPERMNNGAANKLLKLLEEPPDKTVFLLVSHDYENIIPTIQSRTQLVKINALSDEEVSRALIEKYDASKEKATSVAHLADGDFFRALQLLGDNKESNANFDFFVSWMRFCYKQNLKELVRWTDEMAKVGRENQKRFLEYSLHMVRQCIVKNYTKGELGKLTPGEAAFADKFSPFINHANVIQLTDELNQAHREIGQNIYGKILFFDLSIKVSKLLRKT
ncbi:DNA polymerase III subunit [Halocola ammonii]